MTTGEEAVQGRLKLYRTHREQFRRLARPAPGARQHMSRHNAVLAEQRTDASCLATSLLTQVTLRRTVIRSKTSRISGPRGDRVTHHDGRFAVASRPPQSILATRHYRCEEHERHDAPRQVHGSEVGV